MTTINQKDYLKKYLKIGKGSVDRRKKKKGDKTSLKGLKIIDDDVDNSISREIQDDLDAANEDAPQIVAIIDERPPSLRIDEQTKSNLWQPIGEATSISTFQRFKIGSIKLNINKEETANKRKDKKISKSPNQDVRRGLTKISDELSLTKKSYEQSRKKYENYSSTKSDNESPDIKRDDDYSPPRNKKDIDFSPSRNNTPIRTASGDQSPPRKGKEYNKSPSEQRNNYSPSRKSRNSDQSPIRKSRTNDQSPIRKSRSNDQSLGRKKREHTRNDDYSPPRKSRTDDQSFRKKREHDKSPSSQKNDHTRTNKKSRWGEQEDNSPPRKMQIPETTMSGKKSGLQNAKNLIKDITHLQHQEEELFKKMSTDVSGANAATIVRKVKKTDQVPDPEIKKRENELKEKYSLWGKGVKQVQDENEKVADQLKEMNKPLARYADDEDLEKYLKEQEREGDPMLAYIRKKRKTAAVEQGISEKPTYLGDFMPNRFGIRPGYRWDGVDRSNGYEKKWFQVENSKKAMQDEALQWSQEDM